MTFSKNRRHEFIFFKNSHEAIIRIRKMKKKFKKKLEELCIVLINNKVMANLDFANTSCNFFLSKIV